jgi:uncharacterized RDD family membrane protein YckC
MFASNDEGADDPIVPAGLHLAAFGRRAGGVILDQLLVSGCVFLGFFIAGYAPADAITEGRAVWFSAASVCLGLVYETLPVWRWGRTLGKLAFGTRVVRIEDGGGLGLVRAFQRSLVPTALSAVPGVGPILGLGVYTWAFFDPLRQGVHDKAAGSLVVGQPSVPA